MRYSKSATVDTIVHERDSPQDGQLLDLAEPIRGAERMLSRQVVFGQRPIRSVRGLWHLSARV